MLYFFSEEDTVRDLQSRIAAGVSQNQFVFVFQSRTLECTQRLANKISQREHTLFMKGVLRGGMPRELVGEWDCKQCGATRVWPARTFCFRCGFKKDGNGYIASVLKKMPKKAKISLCLSLVPFVARATGRAPRNQNSGLPTMRVRQAPHGPNNNNKGTRNKQYEPVQSLTLCRC